jgi:predicted nucleic-acid-binding protein
LIETNEIWLCKSVLLESEWVLHSSYEFEPEEIQRALRGFLGLPGVKVEDSEQVARALDWHSVGMEFADALHLAGVRW